MSVQISLDDILKRCDGENCKAASITDIKPFLLTEVTWDYGDSWAHRDHLGMWHLCPDCKERYADRRGYVLTPLKLVYVTEDMQVGIPLEKSIQSDPSN